jgi:hypothetical protein
MTDPEEITLASKAWSAGDRAALDRLMPKLYRNCAALPADTWRKRESVIRCKPPLS